MTDIPTLIARAREMEAAATPGEWKTNHDSTHIAFRPNPNGSIGDYHYATIHGWKGEATANGQFIAWMRSNLIPLLDALEASQRECGPLRTELALAQKQVRDLRRVADAARAYQDYCDHEGDFRNGVTDPNNTSIDEGNINYDKYRRPLVEALAALPNPICRACGGTGIDSLHDAICICSLPPRSQADGEGKA